jgi:hypothetical protein
MLIKGKYVDPLNKDLTFWYNEITIWDSQGGRLSFEEYTLENKKIILTTFDDGVYGNVPNAPIPQDLWDVWNLTKYLQDLFCCFDSTFYVTEQDIYEIISTHFMKYFKYNNLGDADWVSCSGRFKLDLFDNWEHRYHDDSFEAFDEKHYFEGLYSIIISQIHKRHSLGHGDTCLWQSFENNLSSPQWQKLFNEGTYTRNQVIDEIKSHEYIQNFIKDGVMDITE